MVTEEARKPKRRSAILYPHQTLQELRGIHEATKYAESSRKKVRGDIPYDIYTMMLNIFRFVSEMVRFLPMQEATKALLNEEVLKLAKNHF